jgi:hypothetical protein
MIRNRIVTTRITKNILTVRGLIANQIRIKGKREKEKLMKTIRMKKHIRNCLRMYRMQ